MEAVAAMAGLPSVPQYTSREILTDAIETARESVRMAELELRNLFAECVREPSGNLALSILLEKPIAEVTTIGQLLTRLAPRDAEPVTVTVPGGVRDWKAGKDVLPKEPEVHAQYDPFTGFADEPCPECGHRLNEIEVRE